jgi:hypothetical protein
MEFLKKFWNWLLGQTTVDEKIEAKVAKVTKEVSEVKAAVKNVTKEAKDVAEIIQPKRKRNNSKSRGNRITSGASPKLAGSGASSKLAGKK